MKILNVRLGAGWWKRKSTGEKQVMIAVTPDPQTRTIVMNFGKPIAWIGLSPDEARAIAVGLLKQADELDRGK